MSSSNSLEVYFSAAPDRAILRRPLYFHHTPKTAGTSFRYAMRHFMREHGAGRMVVPNVRVDLKAAHRWPRGLAELHDMVAAGNRIEVLASHYTALLADAIDEPIVSLIRDPDEHYESYAAFHADFARHEIAHRGSVEAVLRHPKFNNPQLRSFFAPLIALPVDPPADAAKMDRLIELIDRTLKRFTLFPTSEYPAFLDYCRHQYGAHLIEVREKRRTHVPADVSLLAELARHRRDHDPVWLDRIFYDRVKRLPAPAPQVPDAIRATAYPSDDVREVGIGA